MNKYTVINVLFLQVLWFAAILGAAHQWMTPASIWFLSFFCLHLIYGEYAKQDLVLVAFATLVGFTLDSVWVQLGWLNFSYALPYAGLAPFWIVMLWAGLSLTLNHSLRWLQTRLILAAAFSMLSAPLSYLAASRLGAVEIVAPLALYVALSLSWAALIPLLLAFARSLHKPRIIGQPL